MAKPETFRHPKHNNGSGRKKGEYSSPEPADSELALQRLSVKGADNNWYARSTDGKSIYRYMGAKSGKGIYHWTGTTGDPKARLRPKSGIIKALGFATQGSKRPK